jgi:hypothetical protein
MDTLLLTRLLIGLAIFVITSVGGLAVVGFIVVRLPADYFSPSRKRHFLTGRHPFLRATGLVLKNVLGVVTVVVGFVLVMPGVPGPGVLTILVGIMLLDFPGKLRLERWLVCRSAVLRTINRLRAKYGRLPLRLDSEESFEGCSGEPD